MASETPHPGEVAVCKRLGVPPSTVRKHAAFHEQALEYPQRQLIAAALRQPHFVLGALDARGRPWASLLVGELVDSGMQELTMRVDAPDGDPLRELHRLFRNRSRRQRR